MKQTLVILAGLLLGLTPVVAADAYSIKKVGTVRNNDLDMIKFQVSNLLKVSADISITFAYSGKKSSYRYTFQPGQVTILTENVPTGTLVSVYAVKVTPNEAAKKASPKQQGGTTPSPTGKDKAADSSKGSEDVRQALLDAQKKQVSETLKGKWVVQSGPGIGSVDAMGCFGVNGERVQYMYTFDGNGEGELLDIEQNKINRAGERTSYTTKRRMSYTISGNTISVTLGPCKLVSGETGTWILQNKISHETHTLSDGLLDVGAGWKFKKRSGNTLPSAP